MVLTDIKLKEADFLERKISDLSDTPNSDGMTSAQLKAFFDYMPKELLAGAINAIIDRLTGLEGACDIGAVMEGAEEDNVQAVLDLLKRLVDDRPTKAEVNQDLEEVESVMIRKINVNGEDVPVEDGTVNLLVGGGSGGGSAVVRDDFLYAEKWADNRYSFEDVFPKDRADIEIEPSVLCDEEQIAAWNDALIYGSATENVCTAKGTMPTVDIPIILKVVIKND